MGIQKCHESAKEGCFENKISVWNRVWDLTTLTTEEFGWQGTEKKEKDEEEGSRGFCLAFSLLRSSRI